MNGFLLSARARFDIEDTIDGLEAIRPTLAGRWQDELYGLLNRLARFPQSAPVREELAPAPVRVAVMGDFLIFYDSSRTPLRVLRVLRASRDVIAAIHSSGEVYD